MHQGGAVDARAWSRGPRQGSAGIGLGALRGAAVSLLFVFAASSAQPQSAVSVMRRVLAKYQSLSSYSGDANVDNKLISGGKQLKRQSFAVHMVYRKPNLLQLNFTTPDGSRMVYSDGATFSVYDPLSNLYLQSPTAPTLAAMAPLLRSQASIEGEYDPLFFLSHASLPAEIHWGSVAGATVNGRPAYRVAGTVRLPMRKGRVASGAEVTIPASVSYWTWYVDRQTNLLRRVEMRAPNIAVEAPISAHGRVTTRRVIATLVMRHTVVSARPDGPAPASLFAFRVPRGAIRRKTVAELLGKK